MICGTASVFSMTAFTMLSSVRNSGQEQQSWGTLGSFPSTSPPQLVENPMSLTKWITLAALLLVYTGSLAYAAPATQPAAPATQPTAAPGAAVPTDANSAVDTVKDLWSALKAHRWWFAVALGIYVVLFLLGIFGVFKIVGTFWAWITVATLSLAAGVFAAIDKDGFNWDTLFSYASAGPVIAYVRDFGKDVLLKKFKEWRAKPEPPAPVPSKPLEPPAPAPLPPVKPA